MAGNGIAFCLAYLATVFMLSDILNKKQRLGDFFADSSKGFMLIWNSGKKLTIFNFSLFILSGIFPLLSLLVLKQLIDYAKTSGINWEHMGPRLLLFGGLQLLSGIISQYSNYKTNEQQQIIADKVVTRVLNKAIDIDLEYYENPAFYDELTMAHLQSLNRPGLLIAAFQGIIQNIIMIALMAGYMMMAHWSLLILIVMLSVPLAISKLMFGMKQYQLDRESIAIQRKANGIYKYLTTDTFAKEVRLFDFGRNFISNYIGYRKTIFNKKQSLQLKFLRHNNLIQVFEIIVVTAIYFIIIGGAVSGAITLGGMVVYFTVFQRLQTSISSLFQSGINLFQNQLYLRQILDYLNSPVLIKDAKQGLPVPVLSEGIVLNNINFIYPDTDRPVLKDINMVLKPGQITAIVGENGSGKSTLIKLICRLYEIQSGTIKLDDTDITQIGLDDLRKSITVLFQDFGKYDLTIEENIVLGNHKTDALKLNTAIEKSGLKEKLASFPMGIETPLGRTFENGEQLSGGQWQKIALARMFYKECKILILDEPTSSMDPVAEHTIFENLNKDIGNKIVILVTHRLYNLKMAGHIYVMTDGKIAEQGTFDDLINAGGTFANIYNKQKI